MSDLTGFTKATCVIDDIETWPDVGVSIWEWVEDGVPSPRSRFTLEWTDYVANDWCEVFDTLSVALARLAVLAKCEEHDWDVFMTHDASGFAERWSTFSEGVVS